MVSQFRWLATAGIELRVHGRIVLIDPFFSRFPLWKMWFGRVCVDHDLVAVKIQSCDSVLVTHAHWDHIMDVPDVVHNTGALAYGSPNCCQLLAACGEHGIIFSVYYIRTLICSGALRTQTANSTGSQPALLTCQSAGLSRPGYLPVSVHSKPDLHLPKDILVSLVQLEFSRPNQETRVHLRGLR